MHHILLLAEASIIILAFINLGFLRIPERKMSAWARISHGIKQHSTPTPNTFVFQSECNQMGFKVSIEDLFIAYTVLSNWGFIEEIVSCVLPQLIK